MAAMGALGQDGQELEPDLPLLTGQLVGAALEQIVVRRFPHRHPQLLRREGLGQKIERAQLGGPDRRLQRGVGRDHDGEQLDLPLHDPVQHIQAGHAGQLVIEQQQLRPERLDDLEALLAAGGLPELESQLRLQVGKVDLELAERALSRQAHPRLVIDDENPHRVSAIMPPAAGGGFPG